MMPLNWLGVLVSAFIPLVIGFVWYHPKVFGNTWMKASRLTEEDLKAGNMLVIFGLSLVGSFFVATMLQPLVIHQIHVFSIMSSESGFAEEGSKTMLWLKDFMVKYGKNSRGFDHGAVHGALAGVFLISPVIIINALFERKGFKYILINVGYWTLCLTLMGSIICGWY